MIALTAVGCSKSAASDSALGFGNAGKSSTVTAQPIPVIGPPTDPFRGSPADRWADGTSGIVLPKAEPIGGYTRAQVQFAYEKARQMLGAAFLDRQTLSGGAPTAFANLLIGQNRTFFLDGLKKKGVDKQGSPLSTLARVASFPPGDAQLIGSVIKVNGVMSAQSSVKDGREELDMRLDYLFVYPIEPPLRPASWTRFVVQAQWTLAFGDWAGGTTSFEPWMTDMTIDSAPIICGTTDGYLHPAYPSTAAVSPQASASPTGRAVNPYVLGHNASACENSTGT